MLILGQTMWLSHQLLQEEKKKGNLCVILIGFTEICMQHIYNVQFNFLTLHFMVDTHNVFKFHACSTATISSSITAAVKYALDNEF